MPARSNRRVCPQAFTLVELILVMALLVVFLAISAPSMARSFSNHALKQEATRLLALTEYARNEAVSQGIPMVVWIDSQKQSFGVQAKNGFGSTSRTSLSQSGGNPSGQKAPSREKEYTLSEGIHFELGQSKIGRDGQAILTEFAPDGTPDASSLPSVQIVDRNNAAMSLSLTNDGWGYEIGGE